MKYDQIMESFHQIIDEKMKKISKKILAGSGDFYELKTHQFLSAGAWELILPLKKEEWPREFSFWVISQKIKGKLTSRSYVEAAFHFSLIDLTTLRLGYALSNGVLTPAMFFVQEGFFQDEKISRTMALDPCLGEIMPDCYFGVEVELEDIERCISSGENPLESFVSRTKEEKLEEIIFNHFVEMFIVYTKCDPNHFPEKLKKFCLENDTQIPPQEENFKKF